MRSVGPVQGGLAFVVHGLGRDLVHAGRGVVPDPGLPMLVVVVRGEAFHLGPRFASLVMRGPASAASWIGTIITTSTLA